MNGALLGLLAETPIHPGSGQSMGAIDLPVSRERVTGYPFLSGSGLKGALRDATRGPQNAGDDPRSRFFGQPEQAGAVLISDARLLLLPVRSLDGAYRWVTCPYVLERLARDLARIEIGPDFKPPKVGGGTVAFVGDRPADLMLEERLFAKAPDKPPDTLIQRMQALIASEPVRNRVKGQLAILNDDDFGWFARYGLPVQARNHLKEDGTKASQNLWYEETLPTDAVLYSVLVNRPGRQELAALAKQLEAQKYLCVGGNETVGHGWMSLAVLSNGA